MAEEAKEVVIFSLPTDVVKPYRRARPTSSVSSIASGSPDFQSDEDAIPRYLRASKGSCHDFCKYGIKDINEVPLYFSKKKDFDEAMERLRKLPRNLRSRKVLDVEHSQTDVSMIHERRKKSEVDLRTCQLKTEPKDEFGQTELPPEKIIFVSDPPIKNAKESTEQPSSMKCNGLLHNQLSYDPTSETYTSIKCLTPSSSIRDCHRADEHEAVESSRMLSNLYQSIEDPGMTAENVNELGMDMIPIQVKDLSTEPVGIKYVYSPPTLETIASSHISIIEVNHQSQGLSSRTASVTEIAGSGEHEEGSRTGKSANKLIEKKNKVLLRSSEQSTITKSEVNRRKSYAKQRNGNPLGAKNEVSVLSLLRTSSLRNNTASALSPADRSTKQGHHLETISVEKKSTLRNKAMVPAGIGKNERPAALKKIAVKLAKVEIEQESSPSITKATETLINKVSKKKYLASPKISASSLKPVTSSQLKKKMAESPTTSGDLRTENNQANIVKVSKIMKGNKSHPSPVSSRNDRRYRNKTPAITMKDQVKGTSVGLKEKISGDVKPKARMMDLNAMKQKHRSSPSSTPRSGEANESPLHKNKNVSFHSSSSPKIEEMRRERKIPSLNSDDNQSLSSHRLHLNKVKVTASESRSESMISPVSLKSRQGKTITAETSPSSAKGKRGYVKKAQVGGAGGSAAAAAAAAATSFGDPSVPRRHQDIQDIKPIRGLFNHVIEETASELIKTRRSRVKALVGAFETVISLQ